MLPGTLRARPAPRAVAQATLALVAVALAHLAGGCGLARNHPADDQAWRRRPVPIPPLYADFTTDAGARWQMITPLFWRVEGDEKDTWHLLPLAHGTDDRGEGTRSGHILNYAWGREGDGGEGGEEGGDDGAAGGAGYDVLFPIYWRFADEDRERAFYGPLYRSSERGGKERERTLLFPWLYSSESDNTGYAYWSVLFRLFGYERQVFDDAVRSRLWLFFAIPIPLGEEAIPMPGEAAAAAAGPRGAEEEAR